MRVNLVRREKREVRRGREGGREWFLEGKIARDGGKREEDDLQQKKQEEKIGKSKGVGNLVYGPIWRFYDIFLRCCAI